VTVDCSTATEGDICGAYGSLVGPWSAGAIGTRFSICCSSICSALDRDPLNCGRCGEICPRGTYCNQGACIPTVDCALQADGQPCGLVGGQTGICCNRTCVDPSTDPKHCGFFCATACPIGSSCSWIRDTGSRCLLADGGKADCSSLRCDPGWACVPSYGCVALDCTQRSGLCARDAGSGAGYVSDICCGGACGASANCTPAQGPCEGREDGERCDLDGGGVSPKGLCCAHECVDPASDRSNCGGCGLP